MLVSKPIILIGTGRNGSTLLQHTLSLHPGVAWVSGISNYFPALPSINKFLMRGIDIPLAGRFFRRFIRPSEAYFFWEHYGKGFHLPIRDLTSADVTVLVKNNIQDALSKVISKKRNRLMIKITGWPRIGFFQEMFENARFVHLVRDGRAVANSMIQVEWWWGWRGPQNWRWGELPPEYQAEWESHDRSFIALAAIEWKMILDAFEIAKKNLKDGSLLQIKYEDFCLDPQHVLKQILDFSELAPAKKFMGSIKNLKIENKNFKWKTELTEKQKSMLETVLASHLKKYGY
jgi:hypothetical protein